MAKPPDHNSVDSPWRNLARGLLETPGPERQRLSLDLHVPVTRMTDIVRERRAITADTVLRLARYFGTSAQFWINLRGNYDLEMAHDNSGRQISAQVKPRCAV
jgi:addiction module HigA family antidote